MCICVCVCIYMYLSASKEKALETMFGIFFFFSSCKNKEKLGEYFVNTH